MVKGSDGGSRLSWGKGLDGMGKGGSRVFEATLSPSIVIDREGERCWRGYVFYVLFLVEVYSS